MKKLFLFIIAIFLVTSSTYAQSSDATYVGPETCIGCHGPQQLLGAPDKSGWRSSMHANGYSAVLTDANSMVLHKGIVNDYDQNGIDDFIDSLDFNNISSVFDPYKPNAPILAYSSANGYTITIGTQTHRVYLTYGGSGLYKQRYGVRINTTNDGESKDIYISPIQFNEKTHEYVLYHADAWYDASNLPIEFKTLAEASTNSRSLAKGCSGCHVTGLTLSQTADGEWVAKGGGINESLSAYTDNPSYFDLDGDGKLDQINTGCETCHGPGSEHVTGGFFSPNDKLIINPKHDLTADQANNICGMCHSRGKSLPNNTFSFPFDDQNMKMWAPGDMVSTYYTDGGGYWGDGKTSKKHHQQFYDFYKSSKPTFQFHQVACYECHDVHNTVKHHIRQTIEEELPDGSPITIAVDNDDNSLCLACHATHGDFENISVTMVANITDPDSLAAIAVIVTDHTHHPYDPTGTGSSRCSKCHMAKTAKSAIAYDIHGHTFEVLPPEKTIDYQMPNSCAVSCHAKTSYPNLAIPITSADFTDWGGTNQQNLASVLNVYYGPNGIWWKTGTTGIHYTDFKVPTNYDLSQNYPNPFNPTTNINFSVPEAGNVKVVIYDAIGNQVEVLVDEFKAAGNFRVDWNASKYASGVYFYRMQSNNFIKIKKMVLMK